MIDEGSIGHVVPEHRNAVALGPAYCAAAAAVLVFQAYAVLSHWPWQDEWQAQFLATETGSLSALIGALSYEGHPVLWYLWLRLIADVVPQPFVLSIAALLLGCVTSALILFASPFTRPERLGLALSEFVFFEFNVLSRGTTLGAMLCFLTAALWRRRLVWLPVILLPQCDFFFGVISVILLALLWRGPAWSWLGAAAWAASSIGAAITVIPAADMVPAIAHASLAAELIDWVRRMGLMLWPMQFSGFEPTWNYYSFPLLAPWGWLAFIWLGFHALRGWPAAKWAWAGFVALQLVFSLTVYPLAPRHLMICVLLLMVLLWIGRGSQALRESTAVKLWIAASAIAGVATTAISHHRQFDTAHVAAAELRRAGWLNQRIASFPLSGQQAVTAASGVRFEHPERDCLQSFVRWDSQNLFFSEDEVARYLEAMVARKGRINVLTYYDLGFLAPDFARLRYSSPAGFNGYSYRLYTIGLGARALPAAQASCFEPARTIRAAKRPELPG